MVQSVLCHSCGTKTDFEGPVGREAICEQCNAYLHCCRNCRFYEITAHNECREPMAERVLDKEQTNFCDYFSPADAGSLSGPDIKDDNAKGPTAKDALEQLFKKS